MSARVTLYRGWRIEPGATAFDGPFMATHEDYDGAPDARDDRHLRRFKTVEEAKAGIDEREAENAAPDPKFGEWVSVEDAMPPTTDQAVIAWGLTGWLITALPIREPFCNRHHIAYWTPLPELTAEMIAVCDRADRAEMARAKELGDAPVRREGEGG